MSYYIRQLGNFIVPGKSIYIIHMTTTEIQWQPIEKAITSEMPE